MPLLPLVLDTGSIINRLLGTRYRNGYEVLFIHRYENKIRYTFDMDTSIIAWTISLHSECHIMLAYAIPNRLIT